MSGFKVLVADDSPVYRKLVEHALAEDSCSVLFANSGHQAIEIFERERPDRDVALERRLGSSPIG